MHAELVQGGTDIGFLESISISLALTDWQYSQSWLVIPLAEVWFIAESSMVLWSAGISLVLSCQ
jgi:hypothetical protein